MEQSEASVFHTVVRWRKLGEVEKEYTLHNSIVLAMTVPKLSKLVEICQSFDENILTFFGTRCSEWLPVYISMLIYELEWLLSITYVTDFVSLVVIWITSCQVRT